MGTAWDEKLPFNLQILKRYTCLSTKIRISLLIKKRLRCYKKLK